MGHDQPIWRRSATHTLHAAMQLKAEIEERLLAATGIGLADNEALLHLNVEPLRMSTIAGRLVLSRGGTTKVIDRLEADGLVHRSPDPDDRRATIVEITPTGRETLAITRPITDVAIERFWAAHLTDEEATTIVSAMNKILHGNPGWL